MIKRLLLAVLLAWSCAAQAVQTPNLFHILVDVPGGFASYLRPMPDYTDVRVLAANTNEDHTVPTDARFVLFSATCSAFYVKKGGTAAVPGADVTDGTGSALNPPGFFVGGVSTIGMISPGACTITIDFYK